LSNTLNVGEISGYRVFNNSILTYIFENTTLFQKSELKGWLANLSLGNFSLSLTFQEILKEELANFQAWKVLLRAFPNMRKNVVGTVHCYHQYLSVKADHTS
jgi:hypothetical protein